jgi:gluconate 2-dehydrogenase gamma chain
MAGRREVLLGLMLSLGGPALMAQGKAAKAGALLNAVKPAGRLVFYTREELALVALLSDAIIPRTDSPGALDAGVPAYLDKMMSVWASPDTKAVHRRSVAGVRTRLTELGGGDIAALPAPAQTQAVAALDKEAYPATQGIVSPLFGAGPAPVTPGDQYRLLKRLIAQVYYLSEPGATEELHYELVPGRWLPDAPLAEIGRTWAE